MIGKSLPIVRSCREADEVYCCDFQKAEEYLPEGDQHNYVVVTRGHAGDEICVKKVLARSYAYLGMIGSRKKVKAAFESLEAQGFSKEAVEGIHAPIGLAIGARTPEEIAVSIAAELIQIKYQGTVSTMTKELLETQGKRCLMYYHKKKRIISERSRQYGCWCAKIRSLAV